MKVSYKKNVSPEKKTNVLNNDYHTSQAMTWEVADMNTPATPPELFFSSKTTAAVLHENYY